MPRTLLLLPLRPPTPSSTPLPPCSKPDPDHLLLILVVKKMGARRPQPQRRRQMPQMRHADGQKVAGNPNGQHSQVPILQPLSPPSLPVSVCLSLSRRPILISFALLLCALLGMCCQDRGGAERGGAPRPGQLWHNTHNTQLTHFPIQFGATPTFGYAPLGLS